MSLETGNILINDGEVHRFHNKSEVRDLPEEKGNGIEVDKLPMQKEIGWEVQELPIQKEDSFERKIFNETDQLSTYSDLNSMKQGLEKTYGEIKEDKPPNSPNVAKWFDNGGAIEINPTDTEQTWKYIDPKGREVSYVDGYPVFPSEAKHPVIGDIDIGKFTGDRNVDKQCYLNQLEKQYGLTEIPDGYALHHDSENGNMQLVKTEWHKEFTHAGGHSLFKEG